MIDLLKEIAQLLQELCELVRDLIHVVRARNTRLKLRERWTKQKVIDELNMSESTYKRHLASGLLDPMRLTGTDEYFEEDLIKAMEESRRRGRV